MTSTDSQKRILYLLLFILAAHAFVMLIKLRDQRDTASVIKSEDAIKVQLISEAMKNLAMSKNKRQIVQSEDSALKEKPKTPSFLSDKDRFFDRQTVAKNVDTFQNTAKGNAAETAKAAKGEKAEKKKDFKDLKLSDMGLPTEPMAMKPNRAPASESTKGIKNGDPLSKGLSATNDYVEEVALGDFTHLNTVEYKFYGFYHRIRQKLEQFWGKSIQEKAHNLFRAGRRLPASEDLITSLRITMNAKGEIIHIKILGASGVKELDDAAIESFNQAGPFPNPPSELLVDGKATIEWGFVVKS